MGVGSKIKRLRKTRKLSQAELAVRIGINPTHLGRLESDRYTPSVEVLKKLADTFNVTTDDLLSDDTREPSEIQIKNHPLAHRIRLVDSLEEADQQALIHIIDCMLTKQRMRRLLDSNPLQLTG